MPQMPLELGPEHPQRQHVEHDVEKPAVQEHVGDELPHPQLLQDAERHQTQSVGSRRAHRGRNAWPRNITTLAPMSAFIAVEIGPGPKENDDA